MHKATFWPICLGCEKVKWLLKFYSENNGFHLKYLAHKLIAIAFSHWRMMDSLKAMTFRKFSKHQCNILFTIGRVFKIPRPCTHVDICLRYVHIHPPHRKSFCSLRLMCIFTNYNKQGHLIGRWISAHFGYLMFEFITGLLSMEDGAWKLIHLWSEVCSIARPCTEHV